MSFLAYRARKSAIVVLLLFTAASLYLAAAQTRNTTLCYYPGTFWDGQKCESCASRGCICDSFGACTSCIQGWVEYTENNNLYCLPCPAGTNCCFGDIDKTQFNLDATQT
jgi:hypothetical protein